MTYLLPLSKNFVKFIIICTKLEFVLSSNGQMYQSDTLMNVYAVVTSNLKVSLHIFLNVTKVKAILVYLHSLIAYIKMAPSLCLNVCLSRKRSKYTMQIKKKKAKKNENEKLLNRFHT